MRSPSYAASAADGAEYNILLSIVAIAILLMVCCFAAGCWAHRQYSKRPAMLDAITQSEKTRTRNICVQSQTVYTRWRTTPRFQPLPEVSHGGFLHYSANPNSDDEISEVTLSSDEQNFVSSRLRNRRRGPAPKRR